MHAAPATERLGGCPDRDALAAFSSGRLSEPDTERLAEHVVLCARCEKALRELMVRPADSFEAGLLLAFAEQPTGSVHPLDLRVKPAADALAQQSTLTFVGPVAANDTPRTDPRKVGPYTLIEQIGRGGMGVVYRAVHKVINRTVALKTLYPGGERRPELLARFRREGEAVARLEHPNIVRIYDFDECDGVPYYSMELVEGETLAKRLTRGTLDHKDAAELVRVVAGAVEYAHRHRVIHRDLKPSNVLIAADGTAKVTDFGLAKVLDEGRGPLSETDAVMGTPSYMAPEQAAGRMSDVGPAADVYALGALLYESLTGVPPFASDCKLQTLALVQAGDLVSPSRLRVDVPHDLEAVCLKCLEKTPARRYPSAAALADDLDHWMRGAPTIAWPAGRLAAIRRYVRGHAVGIAIVLASVIVSAAAMVTAHYVDPDYALRQITGELVRNQTVTLIGETGRPGWHRWRAGAARCQTELSDDGTFTLHAAGRALLELLPDPLSERYRVTAQVRHEKSNQPGSVGLFVAHQAFPGGPADVQFFIDLTFNDVRGSKDLPVMIRNGQPLPQAPNVVLLCPHLYSEEGRPPDIDDRWSGRSGPQFEPAGEGRGGWHDLVVTVSPDGLMAEWDGQEFALGRDAITKSAANGMDNLRPLKRDNPFVQRLRPTFSPRGGFGLHLYRGSASFRSVTVAPITPTD
jgi:serine/threonine-protein kinase